MRLLATTNRGLESVACAEIARRTGATATTHHPGWIAFEGTPETIPTLNYRARTLHRVFVELLDTPVSGLDDISARTEALPVERYIEAGQSFGVRSTRIGSHDFGSPDVADVVGQAIIDSFRAATGERLPVDLDDPDVIVRSTVRHDQFTLAIDTTGADSLHRRPYRVCEHPAPIRPTLATAMLELADVRPEESLVDPMCGGGTLPIEAAFAAADVSPTAGRTDFAFDRLSFVPETDEAPVTLPVEVSSPARVVGAERDAEWVACAAENVATAGVDVDLLRADATATVPEADVVAADLPFGIRTGHYDLRALYRQFYEAVERSGCDRLVALTTRPEFLPAEPTESVTFRDGRLDVSIVVLRV